MQLQANIEPMTFRRKMGALKLIERLKRHGDFWRNYNPAERRLKSHPIFLYVTKELSTDFDIPSSNRQSLLETGEFIRHLSPACYNLDLVLPVNKRSCINTELRMAALATIGERFPETHWLHVYMDGSAAGANHNAGAGVYSRYFSLSRAVGANCTNYDGEVAVVHMALTEYFSKSSDDLFEIGKKSLAKELESNVHYQRKFQENIQLNEMTENLPHWTDIFLDAASEKFKEMNPNQLDRMDIFEQHLQSQALPTWNEILFIMYNYSMKTIQKKLFTDVIGTLADSKDISNIKSMVVHDEFNLDHIILAVIEEFLKDNSDVCEGDEDLGSDKTAVLHDLEKKFDKNNVSNQEGDETNNKYMKSYTWIDLLPSKDIEKKFQLEEELLETKAKLENPVSSFKDEKIPNDLIWKHIFPLAVLVWKEKKLGDYLNFQKMSAARLSNVNVPYSRAYELELLKMKLNQERERLKKFTDNVACKSKKLISEQFNLPSDDSTSDVKPSSLDLEDDSKTENDINSVLQFREDEKFEKVEPQANNVLDLSITLQELFEAVTILQQKQLVVYNQTIIDDANYAFDVIDIFKSILLEGLLTRRKELSLLEQELRKLESEDKNVQKDKASSALTILWKYYNVAAKFRDKENKTIAFELENLKELKHMFQEYVDFSANEAMQQRNKKQIRSMKHSYQEIQMLQSDFDRKLMSHLDRCVTNCNSLLQKKSDQKFLVDIKTVDSLLGRLDLKDQEIFMAAKNILVSIADLRKTEIKVIERDIFKVKKKDVFKGSLENKLSEFLSNFIVSISKGFEERNHLQTLLEDGENLLNEAKNNVSSRIKSAKGTCKQLLMDSTRRNKDEIEIIRTEFDELKSKVDCRKRKVADIMTACENFLINVLEKRNSEISTLTACISHMHSVKASEFYLRSIQHFSNATENRNQEINEIEVLTEPLKTRDEELDQEVSSAIDEALCGAFGIQLGMTFFKIQDERTEIRVARLDPETISLCNEFYSRLVQTIQNNMKVMEEKLESLNLYKEDIAEELIQILTAYVKIVERENGMLKTEMDMLASEINMFKENQLKFVIDVNKVLNVCRDHFTKNLEEIAHDIEEIKFQLTILAGGNFEEEDIEKFTRERVTGDLDSIFLANTINMNKSEQKAAEGKDEITETIFPSIMTILQSGINWREDFIKSFSDAVEHLSGFRNKSLQVVTNCFENYFIIGERRREENQKVQDTLNSFKNMEESDFSKICRDCLEVMNFFNLEALESIESELDRLTNTIELLEEEKKKVLAFSVDNIAFFINSREEEIKNMNSDLNYLSYMGSTGSSELLSKCEKLLHDGVDDRKKEVIQMKNDLENWSADSHVLIVVSTCEKHLELSYEKRQVETQNMQELLNFLEEESDMGSLLYSPALEAILKVNNEVLDFLIPVTYTFLCIRKELQHQDERLIDASRKLYCTVLESFKIEKESIVYDIENLQELLSEKAKVTDTENKEAIISFNDLFVTTFNIKKKEYERDVQKKLLQEDIEKKKTDVLASAKAVKKISDFDIEDVLLSCFSNYYEAKKWEHKQNLERKVIENFKDLEEKLKIKIIKTAIKKPTSLSNILETIPESNKKTETFVNRVYEIKMLEIEEEIRSKHAKIGKVIMQRKIIMKDIVKAKRRKMEESVLNKEKKMRYMLDTVKSEDSKVVCTLKDIFYDVVELKNKEKHTLKNTKELEKYSNEELEKRNVWVNLDDMFNTVLNIKEEELEMLKQSKFKEIERIIKILKREIRKRILTAKEKLEDVLKKYRKNERSKALEYAGASKSSDEEFVREEYTIPDEDIFPDIKSFKDFVSPFMSPYKIKIKEKCNLISKDSDTKAGGTETRIPFIQPHAYALQGLAGYVLNLYKNDVQSLTKVLSDLKIETENAIQHGITFITEEILSDKKSDSTEKKGILLDMTAVLNTNTSLLVLGSYMNANCDIAVDLRQNFGLAYFENLANVKKWCCPQPNVREVSIDIGIDKFSSDDVFKLIATKFDWDVATIPLNCSKFEMLIGDHGLLEQIRVLFTELHHQHLLCRNCGMENLFKNMGLSFDEISKFLSAETTSDMLLALPLSSGNPSPADADVALYVCRLILIRAALLTSVCLTSVMERINKDQVSIIINSLFIQECPEYQRYIKTFISSFVPNKNVKFLFCKNMSCALGAALSACIAFHQNRKNPEYYLLELKKRFQEKNKLFSVQSFMKLLENPDMYTEAVELAYSYLSDLQYDVPLSVVWTFNFLNENYEEAEKVFKIHSVSLSQVNSIILQKILSTENFDLCTRYCEFLSTNCTDVKVKIKAYQSIFDLLVDRNMYEEALKLVRELMDSKISLSNLHLPSLKVLHNYCLKSSERDENIIVFPLPLKENYKSSSDSDLE
ncbi:hexokinase_2 domain-containing protein [Trichonephila clavata]|uniref:Hexokinase_2 domain-containing protein n=1 Tax=Trichonephila clavata TaxID=2740835 RepID=A0A8X6HWT3_TRICU|nr:hexokinase_2 domain-containing protein [Trichonephila clavata]